MKPQKIRYEKPEAKPIDTLDESARGISEPDPPSILTSVFKGLK